MQQKNMFDRCYCIQSSCRLKTLGKRFEKFNFWITCTCTYNGAKNPGGFVGFKNVCSRANTYVILTSLNYVHFYACCCWWRQFLWLPGMRINLYVKENSRSSAELPDLYNVHGFLPARTWLLHVTRCCTAFYAIINMIHTAVSSTVSGFMVWSKVSSTSKLWIC